MTVLVDTSIWSLALRRAPGRLSPHQRALCAELAALINEGRARLLGVIRQELLSGLRTSAAFESLCDHLRAFDDLELVAADYEEAARCCNLCRAHGIAGSTIDFLLCAAAIRRGLPVFTADLDFTRYARHLPLTLHEARARPG